MEPANGELVSKDAEQTIKQASSVFSGMWIGKTSNLALLEKFIPLKGRGRQVHRGGVEDLPLTLKV